MKLCDLLKYDDITIQCHDNPDADSIASGFALYTYFNEKGKNVKLIYGGRAEISKPNLVILVNELDIPIMHVNNIKTDGLLLTVDCQYGAGNVEKFEAPYVAVIDHHQQEIEDIELCEIRSSLGSCSTLVWQMLCHEDFNFSEHMDVSTALYYGLFTDTKSFTEISHPTDRDMKDTLSFDINLIRKLKNSNLTMEELEIAGFALLGNSYNPQYRFTVVKTQPCDPNILGFISDLAIQVDSIDVSVVYHETTIGIKFSVRTCIREVMANELAEYLAENVGSGGGHWDKAGGFISNAELNRLYPDTRTDVYLENRLLTYFESFKVIDCLTYKSDISSMSRYKKRSVEQGYVKCTDVFESGTPIILRTLRCDLDDLVSDENLYIIIGIKGDVNPITKEKLDNRYELLRDSFELDTEYFPHIRNKRTGEIVDLRPYAKKCISNADVYVYAKALTETVKVFTQWDRDTYMLGKPGDYLIVRDDDLQDIYIVTQDIFDLLYERVDE